MEERQRRRSRSNSQERRQVSDARRGMARAQAGERAYLISTVGLDAQGLNFLRARLAITCEIARRTVASVASWAGDEALGGAQDGG